MPEILCPKCGEAGSETDLFCRNCGASLSPSTKSVSELQPLATVESATGGEEASAKPRRSWRGCWVFGAASLVGFMLILGAAALIFLASQPGGLAAVRVELIGNPTPYPTRTPYPTPTIYRTASPYRTQTTYPTATTYPTQAPYPTTGAIRAPRPTGIAIYVPPISMPSLGGCRANIRNQNSVQDAVVILTNSEATPTTYSAYVRAGEFYTVSGITAGTYNTFVTIGENWDAVNSRFTQGVYYFRFEEATTFTTCSSSSFGSYQYLDITLRLTEGPGSSTISVAPDNFPKLGQ